MSTTYLIEQLKSIILEQRREWYDPDLIDRAVLGGDIQEDIEELCFMYSAKKKDVVAAIDSLILEGY